MFIIAHGLGIASITNMEARKGPEDEDDRILQLMKNVLHGIALGTIVNAALNLKLKQLKIHFTCIIIPTILNATTAGIAYLARQKNYYADELEALDQNIGKWMDAAVTISSVALLALLTPHANQAPISFVLAAAAVGLNALHAFYHYR